MSYAVVQGQPVFVDENGKCMLRVDRVLYHGIAWHWYARIFAFFGRGIVVREGRWYTFGSMTVVDVEDWSGECQWQ